MSELQRLRDAMRVTEQPSTLDLAAIMRDGRRLRQRRRIGRTGGATLAASLVAAVAVVAVGRDGPPVVEHHPRPAAVAPTPTATSESRKPVGAVVDTGIHYGAEQRVYYFVAVDVPGLPKVTIGLAGGRRLPSGALTTDYLVNDVEGTDRSAGFHEIGRDESGATPAVPTFGYFVGPAQRIVGTVDGRNVKAQLARWSEDPQVVIFWFDPAELAPGVPLDGIVARDKLDRRL
ncbi:hypothetical protein Ais01nite_44260 [Asanoa ishikariensis]|uniref:Uncharacterized protein n=1 Tax=Asanoa ishikariensis TaxID=137265 RepID=A0A1H3MWG0_9ACTN|nr:hypothetical protein [Asanoa ishikariensis]GIF66391.1 hypothetical protein Ais01nite_44260 [Asanoa ishikariensis]SDY81062.1 hypothetical protein SAMN05421684_1671 [Asanoa ishikariensis]